MQAAPQVNPPPTPSNNKCCPRTIFPLRTPSSKANGTDAAEVLRAAAAELIARAEQLEQQAAEAAAAKPVQPLAPAVDEEEVNARIVALDLSSRGVDRAEAESLLAEQFPSVDRAALLDRFFGA